MIISLWRAQSDGLVRAWKGIELVRGTHELEGADVWTSRDMEGEQASKTDLRTGKRRGMDYS
jgi:hypothetical protein